MSFWQSVFAQFRKPSPSNSNKPSISKSMCWISGSYYVPNDFPQSHLQYEFSNTWEEDDHAIPSLGLEIIRRVGKGCFVLTEIYSESENSHKRPVQTSDRFTVQYHVFLANTVAPSSFYAKSDRTLFVLSDGFNQDLFSAYPRLRGSDHCSFQHYLFLPENAPASAESAYAMAVEGRFDLRLLITNGPIALEVLANPKTVDIDSVQRIVKEICAARNIPLSINSDHSF